MVLCQPCKRHSNLSKGAGDAGRDRIARNRPAARCRAVRRSGGHRPRRGAVSRLAFRPDHEAVAPDFQDTRAKPSGRRLVSYPGDPDAVDFPAKLVDGGQVRQLRHVALKSAKMRLRRLRIAEGPDLNLPGSRRGLRRVIRGRGRLGGTRSMRLDRRLSPGDALPDPGGKGGIGAALQGR